MFIKQNKYGALYSHLQSLQHKEQHKEVSGALSPSPVALSIHKAQEASLEEQGKGGMGMLKEIGSLLETVVRLLGQQGILS